MAGIPTASGTLIAAGLLLAAASSALARTQDRPVADTASLERLKFEHKCVFDIPEWRDRGAEEVFLARLRSQREGYAASQNARLPEMEDLLAESLWSLKTRFEGKDDHEKAIQYAKEVLTLQAGGPKTAELRKQADEYVVSRKFAAARRALEAGNTSVAMEAYRDLLSTSKGEEAAAEIFGIEFRNSGYEGEASTGDLDREFAALEKLLPALSASLGEHADRLPKVRELRDRRTRIENDTQRVEVAYFDSSSAMAGVRIGRPVAVDAATATFTLVPTPGGGGGEPFPKDGSTAPFPSGKPLRLYRGTYDVRVFAPGQPKPVAVFVRTVLGDQKLTIQVPGQIPEGMVYLPPAAAGGEGLVKVRTHGTVPQVQAVAGNDKNLNDVLKETTRGESDLAGLPAWFFEQATALAFERASGKFIPTVEQWLRGAFGPYGEAERKYPWGNESPGGDRAYMDPEATGDPKPRRIGGREAGASPFGLEDMAGNVAEWVRNGSPDLLWVVGGHHQMPYEQLAFAVRKAVPGPEAWAALPGPQQNDTRATRFKTELSFCSGLRMVVPVKVP